MDFITSLIAHSLGVINGTPYHLVTNFKLDTTNGETTSNCVLYKNWYNGPQHLCSGSYEKCMKAYEEIEKILTTV